jgi:hypothetical protein
MRRRPTNHPGQYPEKLRLGLHQVGYLASHLVTILDCLGRRCLFCNDVLWTFDGNAKGKRNSRRLGLPILAEYSSRLYALAFG